MITPRRRLITGALAILLVTHTTRAADTAPKAKFWKDSPNPANVLSATFIGGKGNEWLVAGGFQPDGTIVLAGNVAGPVLELSVPTEVIGKDLPAPPDAKPMPEMEQDKAGRHQKVNKEGHPIWERPSWRHDGVTGYVLRCTGDLKKIISAHRLPWTSGAITSATVASDGSILIAGRAGEGISNLIERTEELSAGPGADRKDGKCTHAFVAKLSSDASRVDWVRHSTGPCDAPQVTLRRDGSIQYAAQAVWSIDGAGKTTNTILIPGGVKKTSSISPIDGSIIVAGEHHWPTGREPWRCPTFNVHNPDGSLKYQLYDWGGPFVGLDNLRQVSDSAVRFVTHDRNGNILLYARSDGGNSVMVSQPFDVRTGVGYRGLGINAAGAGVLSAAYLFRLDPKDLKTTASTLWLSFSARGRPNSIWIDNMALADDGSVCITGRSAWGIWQTHNKLADAPPEGEYVAVLNRELDDVRFCSVIPGAGAAEVSYDRTGWGIASGLVNGRRRVLFLGGAHKDDGDASSPHPTPTHDALQAQFGGGWLDGYVVMLDLGTDATDGETPSAGRPTSTLGQPSSASFERGPRGKGKHDSSPPADGTAFVFNPDLPKWVTVDAEFRDRSGAMWPSFMYGKPKQGSATFQGGTLGTSFVVACTEVCQPKGDQSRRVLGEFIQNGQTAQLQFTLQSLGKPQTTELPDQTSKGNARTRTVEYCVGKGTLELGDRKIPVEPKVTFKFGKSQGVYRSSGKIDQSTESVHLDAWLTMKASDLGLKAVPPGDEIDIRIGMSGISKPHGETADKK